MYPDETYSWHLREAPRSSSAPAPPVREGLQDLSEVACGVWYWDTGSSCGFSRLDLFQCLINQISSLQPKLMIRIDWLNRWWFIHLCCLLKHVLTIKLQNTFFALELFHSVLSSFLPFMQCDVVHTGSVILTVTLVLQCKSELLLEQGLKRN